MCRPRRTTGPHQQPEVGDEAEEVVAEDFEGAVVVPLEVVPLSEDAVVEEVVSAGEDDPEGEEQTRSRTLNSIARRRRRRRS